MRRPQTSLVVKTAPSAEPLTVGEAKAQLRLLVTADDAIVAEYIAAARDWYEGTANRALITQSLYLRLDSFPGQCAMAGEYAPAGQLQVERGRTLARAYEIELPRAPLASVTAITYIDGDGVTQTLSSSLYQVRGVGALAGLGGVVPAYGQVWPVSRPQPEAVTVEFVAGYGAAGSSVPASIRQLIRLLVAHQYELREPIITGTIVNELPYAIQTLFWRTRVLLAA